MMIQSTSVQQQQQPFRYYCVLDLEGKVEILEVPVLLIDATTLKVISTFHHYVRPTVMSEIDINNYIRGKYGPWKNKDGVSLEIIWHQRAILFAKVLEELENWLFENHLRCAKNPSGEDFAFITCGNWDIKTQIPKQCSISNLVMPDYFNRWINVKQVYNEYYKPKNEVTGMKGLLGRLRIPLEGTHHSGIDDTNNIAKIVIKMMQSGIKFNITGTKSDRSAITTTSRSYAPRKSSEPCRFYQQGSCRNGDSCRFQHIRKPDRF